MISLNINNMRVLYCNSVFLDYRIPFFKRLNELFGDEFYVMYSPNRYKLIHREDLPAKIHEALDNNAIPFEGDHLFCTKKMSFKRMDYERGKKIPFTFGLMKAIAKIRPDVLITEGFFQWTPLVTLYGKRHNVPVYIGYERTPHTERNVTVIHRIHRKVTDKFIAGYMANGSETKRYLESLGIDKSKIHITGMSADGGGLRASIVTMTDKERKDLVAKYKKDGGIMYLFCGRIENLKGVPHLLKAWEKHIKKYSNDSIVLVGIGNKMQELRTIYKKEKSIFIEGRIEYINIYKYYASADVFILPTLQDNWSLVIPEAMSCGLPVATSIYNGCHPELVHKDENGFVFDPLKEQSLLDALDYFHHQDLAQMGRRSVELEKEFDTEHCAQRFYEAIMHDQNNKNKN